MKYSLKRILTLLLAVFMVISAAACGNNAFALRTKTGIPRYSPKAETTAAAGKEAVTDGDEETTPADDEETTVSDEEAAVDDDGETTAADDEDPEDLIESKGDEDSSETAETVGEDAGDTEDGEEDAVNAHADDPGAEKAEITEDEDPESEDEDPEAEPAEKESVLDHLPKTGDEIHGFRVTDITDFPPKKGKLVSLEHTKSGARLIYIACDDPDKAFNVFYRTVASNDKGIPHVFEHITLSGSGKYPNANLFDEISAGTYNTYMNASTWPHMTSYEMSSLSEDQLLAIADFYMDGLTDPLALRDEHPLKREAFRYELNSPEDEITVTGAVYNEMESLNGSLDVFAQDAAIKLMYPYSSMSYLAGGFRDDILTITLDELKAFYQKYYHPSNMLITLYGDLDLTRFLEMLDRDYLSRYEKQEIVIADEKYVPWTGSREAVIPFPASEESSAENAGVIHYAVALGEMNAYDRALMAVVASLLSSETSPLMQKMQRDFPSSSFDVGLCHKLREPVLLFTLKDSSAGDAAKFRKIVDETISEICEDGLNKDNIDAIVNWEKMENILSAEKPGGITTCTYFGFFWSLTDNCLSYLDYLDAISHLREEADKGTLDDLVEQYLKDPQQTVLAEIDPEPGLREQIDEAFAAGLKEMKNNMTPSQLAELIGSTAEFNTWSDLSAQDSLLDLVKAVSTEDLPEEVLTAEVTDEDLDGIRSITSVIEDAPYVNSEILLDAQTLDYDEIHDYIFLGELLGSLGTEKHSPEELDTALNTAMYSWNIGPTLVYDAQNGQPHPYFSLGSMELEENIPEARKLLEEVLLHTDFSDPERIRYLASNAVTGYVTRNVNSPAGIAVQTATAAAEPAKRYAFHAMQFDYLAYLRNVAGMSDSEIRTLTGRLQDVLGKLLNQNGVIYNAAGSEATLGDDWKEAEPLIRSLDDTVLEPADYSEELEKLDLPKSIAISVPGTVNYNGFAALNQDADLKYNGTDEVVFAALKNQLFFPAFRYTIGAYGYVQAVGRFSSYMLSYRDPDIQPSFDFFETVPDAVRDLDLTQEAVNDAIVGVYSGYAYPMSPLDAAETEISYVLQNKPLTYAEETLQRMKEAKSVTTDDVYSSASKLQKFLDKGVRVTAGSSAAIRSNRDLYELVIDDLTK